jgi:pilus assembly protein Flp/PilA
MQTTLWNLYSRLRNLMLREEGQDLVEYALLVAVIALAATASMQAAAGGVNGVFIAIGATFSSAIGDPARIGPPLATMRHDGPMDRTNPFS